MNPQQAPTQVSDTVVLIAIVAVLVFAVALLTLVVLERRNGDTE